jgi:hypothetical protein
MSKVYVIGYYNHDNNGDEQYKLSFEYVFESFLKVVIDSVEYVDCDKIGDIVVEDSDVILLGGGDILNAYFLDKIHSVFSSKPNKILAISVGLPYAGILINTDNLAIIDYLFIRTQQDKELLSQYFLPERIFFLPDISYLLVKHKNLKEKTWESRNGYSDYLQEKGIIENSRYTERWMSIKDKIARFRKSGKKIIAISLNRHIYSPKYVEEYKKIVGKMGDFVSQLILKDFVVVFLPYNTSFNVKIEEQNMENDLFIHYDVIKEVNKRVFNMALLDKIVVVDMTLDVRDMLSLYDYFYLSVPMRFHACLFSTYKQVPMIPLFTTQKIYNLMLDFSWDFFYEMEKNEKDIPVDLDVSRLIGLLYSLLDNRTYSQGKQKLANICMNFFDKGLQDGLIKVEQIIGEDYSKIRTMGFSNQNNLLIEDTFSKITDYVESLGVLDFRLIKDSNARCNVVSMVSYFLTKNVDSVYNHGLMEKMFQTVVGENGEEQGVFSYRNEWLWIIKDLQLSKYNKRKPKIDKGNGYFHLNYLDQEDYSKVHRSGWQYVFENIQCLESPENPLLLDLYLDKTFHWKKEIYHLLNIIPYRQPWVGFIHHTMDTTFSEYNVKNMVKNPDFMESLPYCKGLIVLSNTLKQQLEQYFHEQIMNHVPRIFSLIHPTETDNIPTFDMTQFLKNKDKKLIHIGGWLRNIFSFYFLKLPIVSNYSIEILNCGGLWRLFNKSTASKSKTETHTIRKVAIKGNHMNNYYPEDAYLEKIKWAFSINSGIDIENILNNCSQNVSQNATEIVNNWNRHLYDFLCSLDKKLEIMEHLENKEYDQLLTENIVFINLVDASAVNTLIECIVRNTPIIVNRHPAVVELLGPGYPLYYGDEKGKTEDLISMNYEIEYLLKDLKNIETANKYLQKIDKKYFRIETFVQQFIQLINNL